MVGEIILNDSPTSIIIEKFTSGRETMKNIHAFLKVITTANDFIGRYISLLVIPLVLITTINVVARYVFNSPTVWCTDVNMQIFSIIVLFGGAFGIVHKSHVRVDVLTSRLRPVARSWVELITSGLFFFAYGILLWQSTIVGLESFQQKEVYTSIWSPPIYPLKMLIPVAILLLLLQGLCDFIGHILIVTNYHKNGE